MIETFSLSKQYGDFKAVEDLSLSVAKGEVFGFLGPNGAGKTTTILMLMGILAPSSGRGAIGGLDCFKDRVEVKRMVGFLPDNPVFYDFLRGRELLEFVAQMHGFPFREAQRRAGTLLGELGLEEVSEEFAVNYSMGMKRRLGLACALVHDPEVLILDEPTNGLDPRASKEVQERLINQARGGKTIFLSTHLLDMAERICSRVGIIYRGKLVVSGSLDEVKSNIVSGGSLEKVFLEVTRGEEPMDAGK